MVKKQMDANNQDKADWFADYPGENITGGKLNKARQAAGRA